MYNSQKNWGVGVLGTSAISIVSPAAAEEQLARILSSPQLQNSEQLRQFLSFVVRKAIAGEPDQIKEYAIATEVFGRSRGFDPRMDTIVRVQASKLRNRLAEYYAGPGAQDPIVIELPRGSYVPRFTERGPLTPEPETPSARPTSRSRLRLIQVLPWALGAVCAAAFMVALRRPPSSPQVVRFSVYPPQGAFFGGMPSVSPDGRYLLSHLMLRNGGSVLWLRPLDSPAGQQLPGTEGARAVGWCDDSRRIVFQSAGKIRTLEVGGAESPRVIGSDVPEPVFGLTCAGETVLAGAETGLYALRASDGGKPARFLELDPQRGEVGHYFPRFLPGGRRFLYFARSRDPKNNRIMTGSLDGSTQPVMFGQSSALIAATRAAGDSNGPYILFRDGDQIVSRPYDTSSGRISGQPELVLADSPHLRYGLVAYDVSQTGVLVHRTDTDDGLRLAWFDRSGRNLGMLNLPGPPGSPSFSRDGRYLSSDVLENGNMDVWVTDVAAGTSTRATFDPETDHLSAWSPDSTRFAFDSHRVANSQMYVKTLGGPEQRVLPWEGSIGVLDLSPDGRYIAFWGRGTRDNGRILLLDLQDPANRPVPLIPVSGADQARFSNDGRWIAYAWLQGGQPEIYVQPFRGAQANVPKWQVSVGGGVQPFWRGDGKELFYLSKDNKIMSVAVRSIDGSFHAEPPRVLFDAHMIQHRSPRNNYAAHPDGQRFVLSIVDQNRAPTPIEVVLNWGATTH